MPTPSLRMTPELIAAAIEGLEEQKKRIDTQITELRSMLGRGVRTQKAKSPVNHAASARRTGRNLSEEARARIAEAQRRRWAAYRKEKGE